VPPSPQAPRSSGDNSRNGTPDPSSNFPASSPSVDQSLVEHEDFDEGDIVVKANQLIRGRINWTKLEHRVVAMLVAQLKQEDESFEMQRVHISDLMDMAQISSRDIYDRAEEVCRKLLNQKVHVRTSTEDGRRVYQGYNCLSTCRYVEGSGYIEAKFNDDMKPFLLQLKRQFTMYRLQNFMQLSSQHSMRVYELIKMQEGLRYLCVSVEELREVLCCEHTYDRFSDFKRYVLERARTEIADTCDIHFTYKVERDGRTPVRVHLLIHQPDDSRTDPVLIWREGTETPESSTSASSGTPSPGTPSPGTSSPGTRPPDAQHCAPGETARETARETASEAGGTASREARRSPSSSYREGTIDKGANATVAEAPSSSSTFNLYSTVLSGLTQDELDRVSRETVQGAIETARQEEGVPRPEAAAASEAWTVARSALGELRDEDPERPEDRSSEGDEALEDSSSEEGSSPEGYPAETEPSVPSRDPTEKIA
jgi:hypothetical protein